jgi:hypothetical protein
MNSKDFLRFGAGFTRQNCLRPFAQTHYADEPILGTGNAMRVVFPAREGLT